MSNLSYTQEYLLCVLKPKGTIPAISSTQIATCLVAGGLLELLNLQVISIDNKKKITIEKNLDSSANHLEPLYQVIHSKKVMTIQDLATKYAFSTGKLLNEYIKALSNTMSENNQVTIETGGLLKNKTLFIPNENEVLKIIEKIRAEFLEEGVISDETLVLGALLQKSGFMKQYFSQYESKILKDRVNEIKNSLEGNFVKEMVDYIDTLIAVVASVAGSAGA